MKTVLKRMKEFKKDLSRWKDYDFVVINDDLNKCYFKIMNVIKNQNKKNLYDLKFIKNHIKILSN